MTVPVDAPDGQEWEVRRRWLGDRGRKVLAGYVRARRRVTGALTRASTDSRREAEGTWMPTSGNPSADVASNASGWNAIGIGAVALVGSVFVLLGEAVLRLVLFPVALVAHVVFRRPWIVEASGEGATPRRRDVVGWSASRHAVGELADELRTAAVA